MSYTHSGTYSSSIIKNFPEVQKVSLEGVSVLIEGTKTGTTSNSKGQFSIHANPGQTIIISAVGYESQQIKVSASTSAVNIVLKKSEKKEEAVVINTGLFARKKESYTGATATFSGNELRNVGNLNLVQSLKSLDPSFLVLENNLQGANPNALPTIELRGKTSISSATLKDEFAEDPNQPLFILDVLSFIPKSFAICIADFSLLKLVEQFHL